MSLHRSSHVFSNVPYPKIERSVFNRSHSYKTTFNSSYLVPFLCDEMVPGDTFKCNMTFFARLTTPIKPIMDNLYLDTFFFFVPLRLLWDHFKAFMGEQKSPADSTTYIIPYMDSTASTGYAVGSIHDYFGIPAGVPGLRHSAMWHRAYNLIYNEWFRDENHCNAVFYGSAASYATDRDDGPDLPATYVLKKRGKRFDYFTSALPWPQKPIAGVTSITLPLGISAPIRVPHAYPAQTSVLDSNGVNSKLFSDNGPNPINVIASTYAGDASTLLYADLSSATAATINSLRQAFQLQRMMEKDARGGTRYVELVRSHFGIISPDARQQRPEYLGGGSSMINIHPIAQTAATGATGTPQGNLAAMGTASGSGHGFHYSATEHGVILGIMNVRADLNYQRGLNRMWSRSTRSDFYWPSLAHLGEQSILNKELYAQGSGNPADDAAVFGYQERYAEYRYKPSLITGLFNSHALGTLDIWHLAQKFLSLPVLNSTFVEEAVPISRVVAVPSEPEFYFDSVINLFCARPMPVYSIPGLIDHF